MRILFASRHALTQDQRAELERAFPDGFSLSTENITWESPSHVTKVAREWDILIGVFPMGMIARLSYYLGQERAIGDDSERILLLEKIVIPLSKPVYAEDGTQRGFVHDRFVGLDGDSAWL